MNLPLGSEIKKCVTKVSLTLFEPSRDLTTLIANTTCLFGSRDWALRIYLDRERPGILCFEAELLS